MQIIGIQERDKKKLHINNHALIKTIINSSCYG